MPGNLPMFSVLPKLVEFFSVKCSLFAQVFTSGAPFDVMKRCMFCASTPELADEFRSKLKHVEYETEA